MARVRDLVHGRWKAQVLAGALQLDVPVRLAGGGLSADELAAQLDGDADGVARLLRLLACLGIVERDAAARYWLAEPARRLLHDHQVTVAREAAYLRSRGVCAAWDGLADAVRAGHAASDVWALGADPADRAVVAAYREGVATKNVDGLLATLPGVVPVEGHVLVVGGANAALLRGVLVDRPALSGTLLISPDEPFADGLNDDSFEVVQSAETDLPPLSLCILAHVLHDLADSAAIALMRQLAGALASRGVLVILAAELHSEGTAPLSAYLDVHQMLFTPGRERTEDEYLKILQLGGLEAERALPVRGRPGLCVISAAPLLSSGAR